MEHPSKTKKEELANLTGKRRKKSLKTLEKRHKALGKEIEKRKKQEAKKSEVKTLEKRLKKLKGKKK